MLDTDKLYRVYWETLAINGNGQIERVVAQARAYWNPSSEGFVSHPEHSPGLNEVIKLNELIGMEPEEKYG